MGGEKIVAGLIAALPTYWTRFLKPMHLLLLTLVGLFAFSIHLGVSLLEGSEGLYAHITRDMARANEFIRLTYLGEPYINKPPLYFWLLALSTLLFGENEVALRLPGAIFCLGTMALTYHLGKTLFTRTAGFVAALVVATTYVFLWYGRRVLFDSALTFFITLAIFAWIRASLPTASSLWYVLSFLAMALGTMIKGLHGFFLPALLILVYAINQRDFHALKKGFFWVGLVLSYALVEWYSSTMGSQTYGATHYEMGGGLLRLFGFSKEAIEQYTGSRPIHWYLIIMWFVFFPWCALIPSSLALLVSKRPFRLHPAESWVTLWVLGFFLAFSLAMGKREPYLMPIGPGIGLMIGFYYQTVLASSEPKQWATPLFKLMLGLLTVAYTVALLFGPTLLHRNWFTPSSIFPAPYVVLMLMLCGGLLYALARSQAQMALTTAGILAVGFTVGVVHFVLPAIDQAASPRSMSENIKTLGNTTNHPLILYMPERPLSEDVVYYLTLEPALPLVNTEKGLMDVVRKAGRVTIVAEKRHLTSLSQRPDLSLQILSEHKQPRQKNYYLLSLQAKDHSGPGNGN